MAMVMIFALNHRDLDLTLNGKVKTHKKTDTNEDKLNVIEVNALKNVITTHISHNNKSCSAFEIKC